MKILTLFKLILGLNIFVSIATESQTLSIYLNKIDSVKNVAEAQQNDRSNAELYNSICEYYGKLWMYDSIPNYADKALNIAEYYNYEDIAAWSHVWLAYYYKYNFSKKALLEHIDIAQSIFESLADKQGQIKVLNLIGSTHKIFSDNISSKDFYFQALKILDGENFPLLKMETLSNLAHQFHVENNLLKADSLYKVVNELNLRYNDINLRLVNNARHAYTLRLIGNPYQAVKLLEQNLELIKGLTNSWIVSDTYNDYARMLKQINEFEKALKYSDMAIQNSEGVSNPYLIDVIYETKVSLLENLNRFEEAYHTLLKKNEFHLKFHEKLQEDNIAIQNETAMIQADRREMKILIITAAILGGLLIVIIIMYIRISRQKSNNNKLLEEKVRMRTEDLISTNTKLKEEISLRQKVEEEIKLNEARLASLFTISQYKADDIQDLLNFALNEAISFTKSKIGYIYRYDEATEEFTLNSWSKDVMKECMVVNPQTKYHLDRTGIWGEAVRQRKEIIVNDFPSHNPHKKGTPEGHVKLEKFLTIPVFRDEKIIATIGVANRETDYNDLDVKHLMLFMDSVWRIVERKNIDEKLKEYLELNETLIRTSSQGIIAYTAEGQCILANESAAKSAGENIEQLLKQNYKKINSWKKSGLFDSAEKALETGYPQHIEAEVSITSDLIVWLDSTFIPFELNNTPHLLFTFQDISESKRIKDKLIYSELKYRSLYENITAGFVIYELIYDESGQAIDFRYIEVNKTFEKLYFQDANQIQDKLASQLYNKPRKEILDNLAIVDETGKPTSFEYYSHTTNKYIDAWFFKSSGNYIGGILNDITHQKLAELALKESETKYRLLFENMTAGFALHKMIYDDSGKAIDYRYIEINPAFEKLTGMKIETLQGRTVKEVLPNTEDYWIEQADKVSKTGESVSYENYSQELGRYYSTFLFRPKEGHFAIVFQDITEKKEAEDKIVSMNNDLQQALATKDKFFSIIAHDLRNPMHGLLSISQLLRDDFDEIPVEETKKLIVSINDISKNTFTLLENLLNWSKLQTGKMDFNPSRINVFTVIRNSLKTLNQLAISKSIFIKSDVEPDLFVNADENMLELVIRNLISNAIKFSYEESKIEIFTEQTEKSINIIIKDHGIGIEEDLLSHLFKTSKDISRNGTNKERGSGLGLLLCKEMILLHEGTINVTSKVGEGSTFKISLPILI